MATYLTDGNDGYVADGGEIVHALEGNDQINVIHTDDSSFGDLDFDYFSPAEVYGNQGHDYLRSFDFGDRLYGDSGNDTIYGGAGRDYLSGGSGNDTIWTGTSEWVVDVFDELSSQLDGDVVWAGSGNDVVHLQHADNDDTIRGEDGYDILHLYNSEGLISQFSLIAGGSNSGLLASGFEELHYYGGSGFEVVEGGNGTDWIYGRGDTDLISGRGGDDTMLGDDGADIVNGDDGDDDIYGGEDADSLRGGNGDDYLVGGYGNDTITDGAGNDVVYGDSDNDTIRTGTGTDSVLGGTGNDVIRQDGTDVISTTINGHPLQIIGGDTLRGESGNDNIDGGDGSDHIEGGTGDDTLNGGTHGDDLNGGTGNDSVEGGNGLDWLTGGGGADKFVFRQSLVATSGADHISDFGTDDYIYFDHPTVTGPLNPVGFVVGANALDANDRFIYYEPYNALYFDQDGNGAAAKVLVAVFDNGYTPTAADILLF